MSENRDKIEKKTLSKFDVSKLSNFGSKNAVWGSFWEASGPLLRALGRTFWWFFLIHCHFGASKIAFKFILGALGGSWGPLGRFLVDLGSI